jgi:pantoate--beta-alanine ligase
MKMKTVKLVSEVRAEICSMKKRGQRIGFVPTMGYLHEGHLSLVKRSVEECDATVVSIFVNPTQFGPAEDYSRYPRDSARDGELLRSRDTDLLFIPTVEEIYGEGFSTFVEVGGLSEKLEGSIRPGHFRGVCTVVCKLFNIVSPDKAYFGWKDAQQLIIIRKMSEELNIPVEIEGCPIFREADGLAASSRNVYIPREKRRYAVALYMGLSRIRDLLDNHGIRDAARLLKEGRKTVEEYPGVELQYLEIVDPDDLSTVKTIDGKVLVLGAIRISGVRLIDNMFAGDK